MKILNLTGIPSPEAFFGMKQGDSLSLFFEDDDIKQETALAPIKKLGMKCLKFEVGGGGVSLTGEITSPPELIGRMALVDICWDTHPGYSGEVAISDVLPSVN